MRNEGGFTLVEALVALVILAVASVSLLRAGSAHTGRIAGLEARAAALWVAENRLVEIGLAPDIGAGLPGEVEMLGRRWRVEREVTATEDPDLLRVDIRVHEAGTQGPAAELTGFAVRGGLR